MNYKVLIVLAYLIIFATSCKSGNKTITENDYFKEIEERNKILDEQKELYELEMQR